MKRLSLLCIIAFASVLTMWAQTSVESLESRRKAIQKEIETKTALLDKTNRSISSTLNRQTILRQQIESRKQVIRLLNDEILSINGQIAAKANEISVQEAELAKKKESYALAVRNMYRHKNSQDQLLFILSAEDLAQSYRRMMYLRQYSQWRKKQAEEIVEKQKVLIREKEALEKSKEEKETLIASRRQEDAALELEENVLKDEIAYLNKERAGIQAEVKAKQKEANTLQSQIRKLIEEQIAESNRLAAQDKTTERTVESKGGFAMTKEDLQLSGSFASNKGKIPFPLKGSYAIVKHFGRQTYPGRGNLTYDWPGIDIQTTRGNTARCIFEGVVTSISLAQNAQMSVAVRHGNYMSIYSHLDNVSVKKGDKLKQGDTIGVIFSDPTKNNETVLHFQLWKDSQLLNPEPWLNK